MALEVGQVYRWSLAVRDEDGAPKDADTVALAITLPDGTADTGSVTHPGVGSYVCDYKFTLAGLHKFTSTTTNPDTVRTDYVTCREFISIVSMADVKEHLGMPADRYTDDEELTRMMQAATEAIEAKAGYTVRRSFTDRIDEEGQRTALVLTRRPVLSVTSVTSVQTGGPSWTSGFDVDKEAGIVRLLDGTQFWWGPWDASYVVGRVVPLEKHILAVKELTRHLWQTQRGTSPLPGLPGEEGFQTSMGWSFSIPRRVLELIADESVPAI